MDLGPAIKQLEQFAAGSEELFSCMSSLEQSVSAPFNSLEPDFDERSRRLWAGAEGLSAGRGGVVSVHRATGRSRCTIYQGIKDLEYPPSGKIVSLERTIREEEERKPLMSMLGCEVLWSHWRNPFPAQTQNRPCDGPARACASLREN